MCLIIPARVVAVDGELAEVALPDGQRASVSLALRPEVTIGQYVMVDRGLVLEVIEAAEAEAIIAIYDEIGQLLDEEDADAGPPEPGAASPAHLGERTHA